ncbi:MAG TPA: hypothetical protein VKC59_07785 [Candidatus Limnocylindrales bacterium]|nr:hypothetical protein [Candidatus Limnocylindrales bacterium]
MTEAPQPPQQESGPVRVYGWAWGPDEDHRPRLPWIGIFLVIFGALLVLDRALPEYRNAGNVVVLAAGLAFLVVWALRRGTFALYAGAFLTAAAVPGLIVGLGYVADPGVGSVAYGVAFLFVASVRASRGGGFGWQALIGVLLVALGTSELALPDLASLVAPALVVGLGVWLLVQGRR